MVGGVAIAVMRALWWPTSHWWYRRDDLLISVATNGMCTSLCSVKLKTYHGASVMDRRIFDCSRWMICVWDGFAHPHSCIPYVHTGLSTHLSRRSLISRESLGLRPSSQYMLRSFRFRWWRFVLICVRQVRRWSRCNSRYLTSVCIGIRILFIVTGGQSVRLVVNFTWADFAWLILIFHLSNHAWRMLKWSWSCCEATIGSVWTASSPVSSAKVAMVVWSVVGKSAVKIK
jgi:hypothetical protein